MKLIAVIYNQLRDHNSRVREGSKYNTQRVRQCETSTSTFFEGRFLLNPTPYDKKQRE